MMRGFVISRRWHGPRLSPLPATPGEGTKPIASAILILLGAASTFAQSPAGPTTLPTTTPTTEPTTRPLAEVSKEAEPVLRDMAKAYADLKAFRASGTVVGRFDVAGRSKTFTLKVTGLTDGDGRFVHRAEGQGLVISNGIDAYLFDSKRNAFGRLDAHAGRIPVEAMDESILNVLLDENPSLLLAITDDAVALLRHVADKIRLPDTVSASGSASALMLETSDKRYTFELDPGSHRIVRSTIDYTPVFESRHATAVKSAGAVITYDPDKLAGPIAATDFSWYPPATATEMSLSSELLRPEKLEKLPSTRP